MEPSMNNNTENLHQRKVKLQRDKGIQKANLIASGFQFIKTFYTLLRKVPQTDEEAKKIMRAYMEEVLHGIFFFGSIHAIPVKPEEFFPDGHHEDFKNIFPEPFEKYNTHLPVRTPYSVLLVLVVKIKSTGNMNEILQLLTETNTFLQKPSPTDNTVWNSNDYCFDSTVVSQSYFKDPQTDKGSEMFWGASLACKGKVEREILIYISCIKAWNKAVAYAVHYAQTGRAIKFPNYVYSEAFRSGRRNNSPYESIPPCLKCVSLFHNIRFIPQSEEEHHAAWPYGNCAEAESFSKLLNTLSNVLDDVKAVINGAEEPFTQEMIDFVANCQKSAAQKLKSRKFLLTEDWHFFGCCTG
ncbi:uncharacterized protein LOC122799246 [Protopterus annectens]|uniref:uncharacterized protein LOC122799246 n=1 Tax=Protopterus annectens TaxID=7888 RepID=UPI001CFAA246|nr:uncharacterized protein LOC122799246 [Protopterus annectens]